jgi:hypothetical protein
MYCINSSNAVSCASSLINLDSAGLPCGLGDLACFTLPAVFVRLEEVVTALALECPRLLVVFRSAIERTRATNIRKNKYILVLWQNNSVVHLKNLANIQRLAVLDVMISQMYPIAFLRWEIYCRLFDYETKRFYEKMAYVLSESKLL